MAVRAVRGATQVDADERELVLAATRDLVEQLMTANGLTADDVISILFTATQDLTCQAPALAARMLGLTEVALLCVQEMAVAGSMPRVIRVLAHVESDRPRAEIVNVYLNGTQVLRGEPVEPAEPS